MGFYLGHPDAGGILLAVYSTTDPALQPIVYVSDRFLVTTSYTLGLAGLPAGSVTVQVDQNAQAMLLLIGNHESANDPHGDRAFAAARDLAHVEATDPHNDRGYANTTFVALTAFTGSNQNLSDTGYQKFSGGLIVQWGNAVSTSDDPENFSFPIPFPTNCFVVLAQRNDAGSSQALAVLANPATDHFTIDRDDSSVADNAPFMWIALGK